MTIHFTPQGIYADTEEERLEFYGQMHQGNPIIIAHLEMWRRRQEITNEEENRELSPPGLL